MYDQITIAGVYYNAANRIADDLAKHVGQSAVFWAARNTPDSIVGDCVRQWTPWLEAYAARLEADAALREWNEVVRQS